MLLTEEDDQVLRSRSDRFDLIGTDHMFLSRSGGIFRHTWAEMVNGAASRALEDGHRLLVVDTFSGLADLHSEEENDAGAIAERLRLLQAAAGNGLAVLFLHHFNKNGQPRGSGAFRGVVDISVRLDRAKNKSTIVLRAESRYPTATPASLTATLINAADGWFYEPASTAGKTVEAAGERSTDEQLWDALVEAGSDGLSYRDLDMIPGLSEDKGKKRFPAWLAQGRLTCCGGGKKTDPNRYAATIS